MQLGYQELDTRAIAPSPTNPRKHFDEAALAELATSIREQGIIQPIVVRPYPFDEYPDPDGKLAIVRFEIIAGERRWRAAQLAGLDKIPAIVKDVPTAQVLEIQIIENLQRRDVNELEEADGYRLMMDDHGYTADVLAEKVGKSKAYIYARLKLCDLAPEPRVALINGNISASVALLIARIPTYAMQARAVTEVVDGNLSARAAADHIQQRYMLRLANATWDLDDADLCPIAGACIGCPKNTSTDRDQYADVAADVCTDPDCWGNKRTAHVAEQAEAALACGHQVISGEKAREWAPHGVIAPSGVMRYLHNRLVALDAKRYDGAETYRTELHQVLTPAVPRIYIEDVTTGELQECIKQEQLWALENALDAHAKEHMTAEEQEKQQAQQAKRAADQQELERETAYRTELFNRTRAAYIAAHAAVVNLPGGGLRACLLSDLAGVNVYVRPALGALQAPDAEPGKWKDSMITHLAIYTPGELLTYLLDTYLAQHQQAWRRGDGLINDAGLLLEVARAYGLDPDAIRAELEAAQNADAVAPAAPQTAETAAPETASTPPEAARAPDLFGDEDPQTPNAPAAENQAAQAPASKAAKAKTTPKTTAQAKPKAPAKNPKSSSRASPAGGKGKTTTSTTAKPKKAKEAA